MKISQLQPQHSKASTVIIESFQSARHWSSDRFIINGESLYYTRQLGAADQQSGSCPHALPTAARADTARSIEAGRSPPLAAKRCRLPSPAHRASTGLNNVHFQCLRLVLVRRFSACVIPLARSARNEAGLDAHKASHRARLLAH